MFVLRTTLSFCAVPGPVGGGKPAATFFRAVFSVRPALDFYTKYAPAGGSGVLYTKYARADRHRNLSPGWPTGAAEFRPQSLATSRNAAPSRNAAQRKQRTATWRNAAPRTWAPPRKSPPEPGISGFPNFFRLKSQVLRSTRRRPFCAQTAVKPCPRLANLNPEISRPIFGRNPIADRRRRKTLRCEGLTSSYKSPPIFRGNRKSAGRHEIGRLVSKSPPEPRPWLADQDP